MISDEANPREDTVRQRVLRAAAHEFANKSYRAVILEDVAARAGVPSKSTIYSHFNTKKGLASAVIDEASHRAQTAAKEFRNRRLSGIELLLDMYYFVTLTDLSDDMYRAAMHLLEPLDQTGGSSTTWVQQWIHSCAMIAQRGIDDGDILPQHNAQDVARLIVGMYTGLRRINDLNEPRQFLETLQTAWTMLLPGLVPPDRIAYLTGFIRRRTSLGLIQNTR